MHRRSNFPAFEDLGALEFIRERGELNRQNSVPNLGKHGVESVSDILVSQFICVCFVLPLDVRLVERVERDGARNTVREFRDTTLDKAVNVE